MSKTSKSPAKGVQPQDDDGYPKQDVLFKLVSTINLSNVPSDTIVIFQWVDSTNQSKRITFNTDLTKDWSKSNSADPKVLTFTKEFPVTIVNENFVKNLCSEKFSVLFVSKADQKILEKIELHYSSLLFPTTDPKFEFSTKSVKAPGIESFKQTLTANKSLLSSTYREYLNPMQICIMAAKKLPEHRDKTIEYRPTYVLCKFFDGTVIKTQSLPNSSKCEWMHKQVVLLGLMGQAQINEIFQMNSLEFEVHDRDEVIKEKPPKKAPNVLIDIKYEDPDALDSQDAGQGRKNKAAKPATGAQVNEKAQEKLGPGEKKPKVEAKGNKQQKELKLDELNDTEDLQKIKSNNYGVVHFTLKQFLEADVTSLKLRRNITPQIKHEAKKVNDDDDSDSDSSPNKKKNKLSSPSADYFDKGSYLVVSFELAYPIGSVNLSPDSPVRRKTIKPNSIHLKKEEATQPEVSKKSVNNVEQKDKSESLPTNQELKKVSGPKLERAVYLFSTQFSALRNEFLSEIRAINLRTLGKEGNDIYYLALRTLTEKEKQDKELDIITGVEFIDEEYHLFIIEGLAEKSMKKIGKYLPENHPHSNEVRILKNSDIRFEQRLYTDFNVDIKKIWLARNLSEIICLPEIYMRNKVPEGIYQTLRDINELRKCYNIKMAFSANLFPLAKDIVDMAQMYAETDIYEDLKGIKTLPFKNIDMKSSSLCLVQLSPNHKNLLNTSAISDSSDGIPSEAYISKSLAVSGKQTERQMVEALSLNIKKMINKSKFDICSLQSDRDSFLLGHKLTGKEKLHSQLKSNILGDSTCFSNRSSLLNSDFYSSERGSVVQVNYKDKNARESVFTLKKDRIDYIVHPKKPPQERIEDIHNYPWHVEKADQEKRIKSVRGLSLKSKDKSDFDLSPKLHGRKNYDDGTFTTFQEAEGSPKADHYEKTKHLQGSPQLNVPKGLYISTSVSPVKGGKNTPAKKLAALINPKSLAGSPVRESSKQQPLSALFVEKYENSSPNKTLGLKKM